MFNQIKIRNNSALFCSIVMYVITAENKFICFRRESGRKETDRQTDREREGGREGREEVRKRDREREREREREGYQMHLLLKNDKQITAKDISKFIYMHLSKIDL